MLRLPAFACTCPMDLSPPPVDLSCRRAGEIAGSILVSYPISFSISVPTRSDPIRVSISAAAQKCPPECRVGVGVCAALQLECLIAGASHCKLACLWSLRSVRLELFSRIDQLRLPERRSQPAKERSRAGTCARGRELRSSLEQKFELESTESHSESKSESFRRLRQQLTD